MGANRCAAGLLLLVLGSPLSIAQEPPGRPAFSVASVRVSQTTGSWQDRFYRIPPQGAVIVRGLELRSIIALAFGIPENALAFTFDGGSHRTLRDRFDIVATPPEGTAANARSVRLTMLRTLFAERFGLRVHWETREVPVYALSVAGNDPAEGLRRSVYDCDSFIASGRRVTEAEAPRNTKGAPWCFGVAYDEDGRKSMTLRWAGPIASVITRLQGYFDRPVLNATMLEGLFEWEMTLDLTEVREAGGFFPVIRTALVEQLGLTLVPDVGPINVLVVDSVKSPTPN